jgi:hypothetical protein
MGVNGVWGNKLKIFLREGDAVVQWCSGAVVQWCSGAGASVQWVMHLHQRMSEKFFLRD